MLKLKEYISEEKNVHMEHIEDLVFNEGVEGTRKAINFLRDLRDMLGYIRLIKTLILIHQEILQLS